MRRVCTTFFGEECTNIIGQKEEIDGMKAIIYREALLFYMYRQQKMRIVYVQLLVVDVSATIAYVLFFLFFFFRTRVMTDRYTHNILWTRPGARSRSVPSTVRLVLSFCVADRATWRSGWDRPIRFIEIWEKLSTANNIHSFVFSFVYIFINIVVILYYSTLESILEKRKRSHSTVSIRVQTVKVTCVRFPIFFFFLYYYYFILFFYKKLFSLVIWYVLCRVVSTLHSILDFWQKVRTLFINNSLSAGLIRFFPRDQVVHQSIFSSYHLFVSSDTDENSKKTHRSQNILFDISRADFLAYRIKRSAKSFSTFSFELLL